MTIKALYPTSEPTLNLDFANTKRLDPRITFSRASAGTYFDENGTLRSAATNVARFDHNPATGESLGLLVEEARTNNIQYSQQLHLKTATNAITQPYAAVSPDGTSTATLLTETTANGYHSLSLIGTTTFSANATLTAKAYLKNASVRYAALVISDGFNFIYGKIFDLQLGAIGGNFLSAPVSASIKSLPNGWYECVVTATVTGYSTANSGVFLSRTQQFSYTGDGVSGAYIWGAQLEAGAFPTSYIPTPATFTGRTSTATFYNASGVVQTAASGVARSDAYFPDSNGIFRSAGLLLEGAATNLLNHSQTFATSGGTQNNWLDTNITRDVTLRTSPDSTANALRVTASAANATIISSSGIGSSAARTLSIFLRRVTGSGAVEYTLDNGSSYTAQAISSSWVRYAFPATTADQRVGIRLTTSGDAIELWGAQLEASSFATSYIPTTTTTVTRSADTSTSATVTRSADVAQITGANFSSWYNQNESTVLSLFRNVPFGGGFWYFGPTVAPRWWARYELGNGVRTQAFDGSGGSGLVDIVVSGAGTNITLPSVKHAVAISNTLQQYAGSANGSTVVTGTWDNITGVSALALGIRTDNNSYLNGTISRLTYYPTRLPNATLQALTV